MSAKERNEKRLELWNTYIPPSEECLKQFAKGTCFICGDRFKKDLLTHHIQVHTSQFWELLTPAERETIDDAALQYDKSLRYFPN